MIGREVSSEEIKNKPRVVMKDVNWLNLRRRLKLGPEKYKLMIDQMDVDVRFLRDMNIMDYSLLTGVHYLKRGNSENIRDKSLSVFEVFVSVQGELVSSSMGSRTQTIWPGSRFRIKRANKCPRYDESLPIQIQYSSAPVRISSPSKHPPSAGDACSTRMTVDSKRRMSGIYPCQSCTFSASLTFSHPTTT